MRSGWSRDRTVTPPIGSLVVFRYWGYCVTPDRIWPNSVIRSSQISLFRRSRSTDLSLHATHPTPHRQVAEARDRHASVEMGRGQWRHHRHCEGSRSRAESLSLLAGANGRGRQPGRTRGGLSDAQQSTRSPRRLSATAHGPFCRDCGRHRSYHDLTKA